MASSSFTPQQKKAAVWIIGILVVLRFAGVPLLEYQDERKQELSMTSQQLERALRLLENEDTEESLSQLQEQRQAAESNFMQHGSDGEFRLQAQQRIQQTVEAVGPSVELFDWLTRRDENDGYIRVHQARVILQGDAPKLLEAQFEMLREVPGIQVMEYTIQPQRGQRGRSTTQARLTLMVEVAGVRAS